MRYLFSNTRKTEPASRVSGLETIRRAGSFALFRNTRKTEPASSVSRPPANRPAGSFALLFALTLVTASASVRKDAWLARVEPAMTQEQKRAYRSLANRSEVEAFQKSFWKDKAVTEAVYLERCAYADTAFGSGQEGSAFNTDQGRIYIANGAPNSIHRLPSSRLFVASEVWYYDSLPRTGYNSRLQFLFYRRNGVGDFRLYSPQMQSIRDLLIPQPGTRLMFPVNDIVTMNDIQNRLKYSPAESEIVEAAVGVARGITGSGNGEIIGRAASIAHMINRRDGAPQTSAESTFQVTEAPEIRVLQFWAGEIPVVDIQVRIRAAVAAIGLAVEERGEVIERSNVPLGNKGQTLYVQRLFLLPGTYRLKFETDGHRMLSVPLHVHDDRTKAITGEAFEEITGERKLALAPDPRSGVAQEAIERQQARRQAYTALSAARK